MVHRAEERYLFVLLGIVLLVGVIGFLTIDRSGSETPAGNVIDEACRSCPAFGVPVCAVRGATAFDYPNACLAACDDARVILDGPCRSIPRAGE